MSETANESNLDWHCWSCNHNQVSMYWIGAVSQRVWHWHQTIITVDQLPFISEARVTTPFYPWPINKTPPGLNRCIHQSHQKAQGSLPPSRRGAKRVRERESLEPNCVADLVATAPNSFLTAAEHGEENMQVRPSHWPSKWSEDNLKRSPWKCALKVRIDCHCLYSKTYENVST